MLDDIRHLFHRLAQDGPVKLKQLVYDEQFFGNTVVTFSVASLDVKSVKDRSFVSSEILIPGQQPEWYLVDDLLNALQIPVSSNNSDLLGSLEVIIRHLLQSSGVIHQAFRAEQVEVTRQRLREVINQRLLKTFGFIPKER